MTLLLSELFGMLLWALSGKAPPFQSTGPRGWFHDTGPLGLDDFLSHLRLKTPGSGEVFWFFVTFFAILSLVGAFIAYQSFSLRRVRSRLKTEKIQGIFKEKGILELEKGVLERIAQRARVPLLRCLQFVDAFDRGVEQILAESRRLPTVERVDLLRALKTLRKKLGFDQANPQRPLKSTRMLPRGLEVALSLPAVAGGGSPLLSATVFKVDDEGILLRLESEKRPLPTTLFKMAWGRDVEVSFVRHSECAYSFKARVLEFRPRGPGFLRLSHPWKLLRVQRRDYLRVEMEEKVVFRWFPSRPQLRSTTPDHDMEKLIDFREGTARDLGGGGLRLEIGELNIQLEDWLELRLSFLPAPWNEDSCYGRVVKIYQRNPDGAYGLEFENVSPRLHTVILKEVEKRNREQDKSTDGTPRPGDKGVVNA